MSDTFLTSIELFRSQAPSFNFELDEEQLVAMALEVGFVTKVVGKEIPPHTFEDLYKINESYGEE